ncbi:MAG: hypothetical protein C0504_07940 [Candidatus Solibacter sp.]|nr:hypothetical protein [Candidatus Solibacter sp.]
MNRLSGTFSQLLRFFPRLEFETLARCQTEAAARTRHKFLFNHKLLSLDSTPVELCAGTFDWAR